MDCEEQLDIYLNDFCTRFTSTTERATTSTMTMAEPCPTSTTTVHSVQLITITGIIATWTSYIQVALTMDTQPLFMIYISD